ncbi:glycolipid transfer protein [Manduca sexta]|uniref:glycolipid transfer protein n=1 Tax=Manduca sexta TaxID=7130 RepID=UPI001182955C|nr:glycolipid transfer protein [Manduca sexta]
MASSSTGGEIVFGNIKPFPPVVNGKINIVSFLEAADDLVSLIERLGTVFAPVKFDMQGNIDKIKRFYQFDENSCLLELMLEEKNNGKETVAEGVLWLNRALLFFELVFLETLKHLKAECYDVNMKNVFTLAYEGSVKKYHNWVTQQLFTVICKMRPTLPQVMKCFEVEDVKIFQIKLASFNITLHLVRCKIDDFFRDNNLFGEKHDCPNHQMI